jgi:hypothetical protein
MKGILIVVALTVIVLILLAVLMSHAIQQIEVERHVTLAASVIVVGLPRIKRHG